MLTSSVLGWGRLQQEHTVFFTSQLGFLSISVILTSINKLRKTPLAFYLYVDRFSPVWKQLLLHLCKGVIGMMFLISWALFPLGFAWALAGAHKCAKAQYSCHPTRGRQAFSWVGQLSQHDIWFAWPTPQSPGTQRSPQPWWHRTGLLLAALPCAVRSYSHQPILLPTGQLNPTTEGDQHGANSILLMLEKDKLGQKHQVGDDIH